MCFEYIGCRRRTKIKHSFNNKILHLRVWIWTENVPAFKKGCPFQEISSILFCMRVWVKIQNFITINDFGMDLTGRVQKLKLGLSWIHFSPLSLKYLDTLIQFVKKFKLWIYVTQPSFLIFYYNCNNIVLISCFAYK